MSKNKNYNIIVIGAGHAGVEAALACARMKQKTLLITFDLNQLGVLSCNPAVGGIGKGQLVREVDALGGEMARAADYAAIQYRKLNASKGAAVWSTRVQVDRKKYALYIKKILKKQKCLTLLKAEVAKLIVQNNIVIGIETKAGQAISAQAVILTPGTFLNGLIHIGMNSFSGGRIEEQQTSKALAENLRQLGFKMLRFKTGTCARLDGKTIDFSKMQTQKGDSCPQAFSLSTKNTNKKQLPCYIAYTGAKAQKLVRDNLDKSPLFSGKIVGTGVRYCPSFEDKIVKFPHHTRHQVFLEPEGLSSGEYYPNGLSTSLPERVQEKIIHSIRGLEKAGIKRFGYGIEHDVVEPTQLYPSLETKLIKNFYLAGQINGTTGYEEAAAQGLIAGINAALTVQGKKEFIPDRSTSYIGVLIDDLVTKGTPEPYRMFTSRVEYRLTLREDNADLRLRKFAYQLGLVKKQDYNQTLKKQKQIQAGIEQLKNTRLGQLLKRPGVKIEDLKKELLFKFSDQVLHGIETEIKYAGFIKRQLADIKNFKHLEKIKIPRDIDYGNINGLSLEIKEKLDYARPLTLGQANRISGITPVAIMVLMMYLKNKKRKMNSEKRLYYKFSDYLKKRFGCRVYKISLDAGFSCPNKDGKLSTTGCIYCDNRSFSYNTRETARPLELQIQQGMETGRKKFKAEKFLVYFQAFTNTYGILRELKQKYDVIKKFDNIVGLAIGTRPDCVNEEILDLISGYAKDYEVWIEYGLQSIHDKTLNKINRGHNYQAFLEAVNKTRAKSKIKICAHVILGLPGETREEMIATADELSRLKIDSVKIHPLHVIKGTPLEELFNQGGYQPLELSQYAQIAVDFLEHLRPKTIIQRLTADCPKQFLIAPLWIADKAVVLQEIDNILRAGGRYQGRLAGEMLSLRRPEAKPKQFQYYHNSCCSNHLATGAVAKVVAKVAKVAKAVATEVHPTC